MVINCCCDLKVDCECIWFIEFKLQGVCVVIGVIENDLIIVCIQFGEGRIRLWCIFIKVEYKWCGVFLCCNGCIIISSVEVGGVGQCICCFGKGVKCNGINCFVYGNFVVQLSFFCEDVYFKGDVVVIVQFGKFIGCIYNRLFLVVGYVVDCCLDFVLCEVIYCCLVKLQYVRIGNYVVYLWGRDV